MDKYKVWSVAIVAVLLATAIGVAFVANSSNESTPQDMEFMTEGHDEYGDCLATVSADDIRDKGYKLGDYVFLSWNDETVIAIITTNWVGLYTFEYFLNFYEDGRVSIACQFANGTLDEGYHITMSYWKASEREKIMPHYFGDVCERQTWMTDEDYANFRCVKTTGMKDGVLYRSYNEFMYKTDVRAGCVDPLLEKYGINQLICLNSMLKDINEKLASGMVKAENGSRYLDGRIFAKDLEVLFLEIDEYEEVFEYIADNDGPYLIFCTLGKDRTGFVITVLEALMGATYDEMFDDYVQSHICLYNVEKGSEEYEELHKMFDPLLAGLHDKSILEYAGHQSIYEIDVTGYDFKADAEKFLKESLGMSSEKIEKLRERLAA